MIESWLSLDFITETAVVAIFGLIASELLNEQDLTRSMNVAILALAETHRHPINDRYCNQ